MARIRSIKPEFFTSLDTTSICRDARLTFIGLWTHVDDEGRCADDPRLLKGPIWPLDDDVTTEVIETHLRALDEASMIVRYEVGGRRYLAVTGWHHQKIDRRSPSKLPAPPEPNEIKAETPLAEPSSSPRRVDVEPSSPDQGSMDQGSMDQPLPDVADATPARARRRTPLDDLKDTLVTATGGRVEEVTKKRWPQISSLATQLRDVGATPDDVTRRAKRYRSIHPTWDLTPEALVKHWSNLNGAPRTAPVDEPIDWEKWSPARDEVYR